MSDIIKINKSEIIQLSKSGTDLALKSEAEDALIKLLDLKDYIDGVVEDVKAQIALKGQEIYPDFKGVVGENIKAVYRAYGDKYETDNPEYKKEIISSRTDATKIDDYISTHGELPEGVTQKERTKKLIISRL